MLPPAQASLYQGRPQLVGKVGHGGQGFAFCLFDAEAPASGSGGRPPAPYQASHASYHFDAREEGLLGALRRYLASVSRARLGGNTSYLRRISGVRPGHFFDVVARVVAADDSHDALRLLYIWDGSDAMPFPMA